MKPILPLVAALFALAPSIAHADDKADAILKEVRLRMRNVTNYGVTLQFVEDNKAVGSVRILLQRPDKYFFGISNAGKPEIVLIANGGSTAARQGSVTVPMANKESKDLISTFLPIISGDFARVLKGIQSTKYITQMMLDETTVVDVVEITGGTPKETIRVYIDNNSQLRKIVGTSNGKSNVMLFLAPTTDPLITPKTFSVISE
ncbi:MAG: hypothetical protein QM758_20120 [Armatimonas sp.]